MQSTRLSRSMWFYQSMRNESEVIEKLFKLAKTYSSRGFDEYYYKIRREGLIWNRKGVLRVYRDMKLSLRRKHKKRLVKRIKQPLETPSSLNSVAFTDGRKLRVINVIDDCNLEALPIDAELFHPIRAIEKVSVTTGWYRPENSFYF